MKRFAAGAVLAAALVVTGAVADGIKSGPQEGKSLSPFHPLNVTGGAAGQKHCLV